MCGIEGKKIVGSDEKILIGFSSVFGKRQGELDGLYSQEDAENMIDKLTKLNPAYEYYVVDKMKQCLGNCLSCGKNQRVGAQGGGMSIDKWDSL